MVKKTKSNTFALAKRERCKKSKDIALKRTVFERFFVAYALLAQLVEQLTLNQWVQGSNPWECTTYFLHYALLAQLVEQLTLNQWVQGSNPWECTSTTGREGLSFFPVVLFFCLVFTHLFAQTCVVNDILFAKILDSSEEKHYFCNKIAHKATFCAMCLFLHRKFKTLIHQYDQTQNSI